MKNLLLVAVLIFTSCSDRVLLKDRENWLFSNKNYLPEDDLDQDELAEGEEFLDSGIAYVGDVFNQVEAFNMVDIVWVIDNSGSMGDEQTQLSENFQMFINSFLHDGTDFKMGITTTDTSGVRSVKEHNGEFLGDIPVITSTMSTNAIVSNFMKNIKVGTDGSPHERGLEGALMALEKNSDTLSQNHGFLREDAFLAIIIVSDENDISLLPTEYYINSISSFKQSKEKIAIYSIVDTKKESLFDPFSDPIDLSLFGTINPGGGRYITASKLTGGFTKDIHENFSDSLLEIGSGIRELMHSHKLENVPIVSTIKLKINGIFIPHDEKNGWAYDNKTNSILFRGEFIPPLNAIVEIVYEYIF